MRAFSCRVCGHPLFFDNMVCLSCEATLGDLSESLIKRDLGIKDMGDILPGHGGLMDRLDSLIAVAPVAWVILHYLVPVT